MSEQFSEAFVLIRDYALSRGWAPMGFRSFTVGPWTVTVNGTEQAKDNIPPYHALVEHDTMMGWLMLIHPSGGRVGTGQHVEDAFITSMRAACGRSGEAETETLTPSVRLVPQNDAIEKG